MAGESSSIKCGINITLLLLCVELKLHSLYFLVLFFNNLQIRDVKATVYKSLQFPPLGDVIFALNFLPWKFFNKNFFQTCQQFTVYVIIILKLKYETKCEIGLSSRESEHWPKGFRLGAAQNPNIQYHVATCQNKKQLLIGVLGRISKRSG